VNAPQTSANTILSAQIPVETKVELERAAAAGYRSVSAEVRLALDEHLCRERPEAEKAMP
jgi:hypothetical protein